jgi:hypothetical protein
LESSLANPLHNLGSVPQELKWQAISSVKPIIQEDMKIQMDNAVRSYYEYLANSHKLSDEEIKAKPFKSHNLMGGETNWYAQIINTN